VSDPSAPTPAPAAADGVLRELRSRVHQEVSKVIVGQDEALDTLLVALAVGGHALLEGVPGTAKTLLASTFAKALGLQFRRAQFTPDLLPSDLTGNMTLRDRELVFRPGPGERPARFVWEFAPAAALHFQDVRRFGRLWALAPEDETAFFEARAMGPEPFGAEFTPGYLRRALEGRRAPLKSFLVDQRRVAGIGNIYADEALFRARLHPLRAAGSVGPREALRLHAAVLETLQAGIDHEGSSIESFIDPAGRRGSFQEILNVYQRTGQPCRVCGTPVERVVVGGRGTHYCPRCQPRRGGMAAGSRSRRGAVTPPRTARPADWEALDR